MYFRSNSCHRLLFVSLLVIGTTLSFAQTITKDFKNEPLKKVLKEVERQTNYSIIYKKGEIDENRRITGRFQKSTLEETLNTILGDKIEYKLQNKLIILSPKHKAIAKASYNSNRKITGKVVGADNEPIIGATLKIKGKNTGAITNVDGVYVLDAEDNDLITISYIGYESKTLRADQLKNNGTTVLTENSQSLNELVVIGYGTQKKINLTGSVAMIKGEDIQQRPVATVSGGLEGLVPGLTVVSASGKPGAVPKINVRGVGTINSSTAPLILIDGVAGGDLNLLNPQDIQSVSVLKDAASSAIYGARAANGVILITTKQGHTKERPSVSYTGYAGFQTPTRLPKLVNGREYMELTNEAMLAAGYSRLYPDETFKMYDSGDYPNEFSNTDWIGQIFKKAAFQTSHSASVHGGSEKSGYFMSYGYMNQDGLVVGDAFKTKRHNIRLSLNSEIINRLKVTGTISFVDYKYSTSAASGPTGVFRLAQRMSPLLPIRWKEQGEDGNWHDTEHWSYGSVRNPLDVAYDGGRAIRRSRTLNAIGNATLSIAKGLNMSGQYAANYYFRETDEFVPALLKYRSDGTEDPGNALARNSVSQSHQDALTQSLQFTLDFDRQLGQHDVSALLGFSQEWYDTGTLSGSRKKILLDGITVLSAGTEDITNAGNKRAWALRSFFGRVNYDFSSKYLFEANLRIDGTSRFAKGNRWGYFPSFSAGWNFTGESFMNFAKKVLDSGKLRVSWGELGNQNVGGDFYPYLTPIEPISKSYPIGGIINVGYAQPSLGNEKIKWETIRMLNAGLDLAAFDNRLNLTFDWFVKDNINALVKPIYPTIVGVSATANLPFENMGKIRNKGWELELSWRDRIGDFRYNASFNLYDVRNKIKDLGRSEPSLGNNLRRVGDPLNAYYGFLTDGLAQTSDFSSQDENGKYILPLFATPPAAQEIVQPGDIKYRDISGPEGTPDGIIDEYDKVVFGDPYPHYAYSLKLNMLWKGFDLSLFFQGIGKADGYLSEEARHAFINDYSIPKVEHLDRWTPSNPNASYPRLFYGQTHNLLFSDYWKENAAYLRLKNVQIGYTFPHKLISHLSISKLRVFATVDNLLTITKYFGAFDPELRSTSGDAYPQVKTFVFGLNINF